MISTFYFVCLLISIVCLVYLTYKNNRYAEKYYWALIIILPIIILGYWIKSTVHSPEAAMVALCFIYLDSTVLLILAIFSILNSMKIKIDAWVKVSVYAITALHLFSIWLSKDTKLYYSSIEIEETRFGTVSVMLGGPMKITHYIYLACVFVVLVYILIYGIVKKDTVSRRTLGLYSFIAIMGIIIYVVEIFINLNFTVLPGLYALGSIVIALTYDHVQSHDILNIVGERQIKTGQRGFCAFDRDRCLLAYNERFGEMLPDIKGCIVDERIPVNYEALAEYLYAAMDVFDEKKEYSEKINYEDKIYFLEISSFSVNKNKKSNGYLLEISDVTEEQKKYDVVEKYNERLSEEVNQKTEHIEDIQNSVVLGLANLVENRDDNTGGHVKRTSDVVKYLVEEIGRQKTYNINSNMAKDIVRAAAMHDLGKISIDSAILCKPGKLTSEEYDIMKTHAPKSGEIVKIILEGVEEEHFVKVAYNLARYHHERYDGKGYPDGLMGENIPIEARIMAVADVYDALVSKRCYKEAMSFDKAFQIMNECMGSQFDPAMRPVFVACRERLETYYSQNS